VSFDSSGFRNPISPATIAPIIERYSRLNSVACHEARNAIRPNEIGFGKLAYENLDLLI